MNQFSKYKYNGETFNLSEYNYILAAQTNLLQE